MSEGPNTTHAALTTRFSKLVGVRLPVVQTGMGWVSGATLTAATANAGGLGILASATMIFDELDDAITRVAAATDAPFGVNLLPVQADLDKRLGLMEERGVAVASFAGPPSAKVVTRLNDAGIHTMVTVGARRHAEKMAGLGVACIIAQGGEGGGHTGAVPTSLLVPDVADAVGAGTTAGPTGDGVIVLGAGGYRDGRGLVAALAQGADGIAMGTRFLLTAESGVPDEIKAIYLKTPVTGTVRTTAIDGAPQRVIATDVIAALESGIAPVRVANALRNALKFRALTGTSMKDLVTTGLAMRKNQDLTWAQLAMAANAPMMTKAAMVDGQAEVGILPTGQVVGVIDSLPTVAEVLGDIVTEAEATLERLAG
ncbi:MAG: nitronate monooxygenase family protein [Candidatus Microthrix subdominans]